MATIGLGVVGLGFMGRRYARFVSRIEGLRLAGVCDLDGQRARAVGAELETPVFADVAALLRSPEVAGLIVATPEDAHEAPVLAALAASKPVLVEKPVAHTMAAARAIEAAARRAGVPVLVGHLLRFEPRWVGAWQRIAGGAIGEVLSVATRRIGNVGDQAVLRGRTNVPLYYGIHDLDVMRWFAGAEATTVYARRRTGALLAAGYDVEDLYCAVVGFANGVLGSAELGWHVPVAATGARTAGAVVVGSQGVIQIDQLASGLDSWTGDGLEHVLDTTFWMEGYGVAAGALGVEIRHFADCVRGHREPAVSLADAVAALHLSLAMAHAADIGAEVAVAEYEPVAAETL
jgi:myo-inositol 2-dehydrogenase/D-chiro-inositol 1-dehydrogenase